LVRGNSPAAIYAPISAAIAPFGATRCIASFRVTAR